MHSVISQAGATWRNRSTNAVELGRDVGAGVGLVRDQAVARLEQEAPRLALRAPAQLGVEPEIAAEQERRQEPGDLKAVPGRGAEEAQGAVDLEDVAVAHAPLDPVEQAVELEPAEELAIPRGPLVADLGLDQHRAEQDRLRQRDVVAVDQPLGRDVLEPRAAGSRRGGRRTASSARRRARASARRRRRRTPRRGETAARWPGPVAPVRSWRR